MKDLIIQELERKYFKVYLHRFKNGQDKGFKEVAAAAAGVEGAVGSAEGDAAATQILAFGMAEE